MTNNNILDVLTYMFDYLFETASLEDDKKQSMDDTALKNHLKQVGFEKENIDKAINWLEDIAVFQSGKNNEIDTKGGLRVYSPEEQRKLGSKVVGLLMFMEKLKQINGTQREHIVEQVMRLEQSSISMDDFKWVVMMVLGDSDSDGEINENGNITNPSWMELLDLDSHETLQ